MLFTYCSVVFSLSGPEVDCNLKKNLNLLIMTLSFKQAYRKTVTIKVQERLSYA